MPRKRTPDTDQPAPLARIEADPLTPQQHAAIDAFIAGSSTTAAAELVGVRRETVSAWANHDAHFQAELNARRAAIIAAHDDKARGLVGQALDTLADLLHSADDSTRLRAAQAVLAAAGGLREIDTRPAEKRIRDADQAKRLDDLLAM